MGETAVVAQSLVRTSLDGLLTTAKETGMIAQLSDPSVQNTDKKAIIENRVLEYGFLMGNVVDVNGKGILSPVDISDRDYFQKAVKGEPVISNVLLSRSLDQYVITLAAPLWKDGKPGGTIDGVVYYLVDANVLTDLVRGIQIGNNSNTYILDDESIMIAHTTIPVNERYNAQEEAKTDSSLKGVAEAQNEMVQGKTDQTIYTYQGEKKIIAYLPVENGKGWSLAITADLGEFTQSTVNAIIITVILVIVVLMAGVVIATRIAKSISKPVEEIQIAANNLAKGNLEVSIDYQSKDELGSLADSMRQTVESLKGYIGEITYLSKEMAGGNFAAEPTQEFRGDFVVIQEQFTQMAEQISKALSQINIAADQVNIGSDQVSSGAQALAQGTTEQASSIQQLSATITEISDQIKRNAENSEMARDSASKAGDEVMGSNEKMHEMIAAISNIETKSAEISKIIKTIDDIAFQTNILALNASVEAARAGSAGKGFAVVADEVRNLAQKSGEAARNTTQLIEETIQAVNQGTSIAGSTAEAMSQVVENTQGVISIINKIAEASGHQADAIAQINIGVNQIASVVQVNSATSEESAAASEELSGQSQLLKQYTGQFRLKANCH